MSTARTMGRGAAWNFSSNLIEKGIVLANVLIILTYLSVYEYGLIELVLSALSLVGMILLPGIITSIYADLGVERARGELGKMKALFHQYVFFSVLLSLVAFGIMFFGAAAIAAWSGNASIGHFLQVVSFSLLIAPLRSISLAMATVHIRFVDQALYPMVEEVAKTAGLLTFFYGLHLGPLGLLYAVLASQFAAVLVFAPRTLSGYRYFAGAVAVGSHRFWEIVGSHRKWSVFASYVGTLTQNAQVWIIKLMLGTTAVGLYAFAMGIMSNVSSLFPLADVFTSLGPRYVEKRDEFISLIRTSVRLQCLLSIVLIGASCIGLPVLVWLLPKYGPAAPLTVLMLFVLVPTASTAVFTPAFSILKRQFAFLLTQVVKLVLTFVLLPASILLAGTLGIGIGMILVNVASSIERYFRLTRELPGFSLTLSELFAVTRRDREVFGRYARVALSRQGLMRILAEDALPESQA